MLVWKNCKKRYMKQKKQKRQTQFKAQNPFKRYWVALKISFVYFKKIQGLH